MDGRKQHKKAVARYVTSPTFSTDSVITTATIDTHERSDDSICGIPGAFFSAYMDKDIKMVLSVRLVEIMVNIATQIYRQHMMYGKVSPVL